MSEQTKDRCMVCNMISVLWTSRCPQCYQATYGVPVPGSETNIPDMFWDAEEPEFPLPHDSLDDYATEIGPTSEIVCIMNARKLPDLYYRIVDDGDERCKFVPATEEEYRQDSKKRREARSKWK